jgi:asparagine synthase (glutamine-hydrolysing)
MMECLRHRGPDSQGSAWVHANAAQEGGAWIANTRLAILDLSPAGSQPMYDRATGNCIVLNGEIYNHLEIRQELAGQLDQWNSSSDTETVLRAYAVWGAECVHRLHGMFALAIFDAARNVLWCARDRLGIKPFYFWRGSPGVVFASEVRAILGSGCVRPTCDQTGLAHFIRFGSLSEPYTMFEDIESLPAGCWMEIRAGEVAATKRFWHPGTLGEDYDHSTPHVVIRRHLERAVREHLLSDVPVASLLSGGIDSSIMTALAAQQSSRPIRTFTVGFADHSLDESEFARAVAKQYATEHHEVRLSDEEVIASVPAAVAAMDLPSADGVNTYIVAKAVADSGTKVVLSGLGGDELFGGYRSFRMLPLAHRWASLLGLIPGFVRGFLPGGKRSVELTSAGASFRDRYLALRSFWSLQELQAMGISGRWQEEPFAGPAGEVSLPTAVSQLELGHYMRNVLLRDADTMSMAHSVEMRVPFLDSELVEYCLRAGVVRRHKELLQQATRDLLPVATYTRRKQGFELPMDAWMRGPLRGFVREGIIKLREAGLLPQVDLSRLQTDFEVRRLSWARLWQMVVLGHWAERYLGGGFEPNSRLTRVASES